MRKTNLLQIIIFGLLRGPVHTDRPKRDMRVQSSNLCGSITVMSYRPCQSIRVPALNAAAARRKSVLP